MATKVSTAYLLKVKGHPRQTVVCLDRPTLHQQMKLLGAAWGTARVSYEAFVAYQNTTSSCGSGRWPR